MDLSTRNAERESERDELPYVCMYVHLTSGFLKPELMRLLHRHGRAWFDRVQYIKRPGDIIGAQMGARYIMSTVWIRICRRMKSKDDQIR